VSDRLECLSHVAKLLDVELNCTYRLRKNELPSSFWQLSVLRAGVLKKNAYSCCKLVWCGDPPSKVL